MNRDQITTIATQVLENSVYANHLTDIRDYNGDDSWDAYTNIITSHHGKAIAKLELLDVINPRLAELIRGEHNGLVSDCRKQMYAHFLENNTRRERADMLLNLADAGRLDEAAAFMREFRDREIPKAVEHLADYIEKGY
ncbi:MAG: hypothetical protein DI609_00770 [Corynebacterium urealyticum]|uniref:Uncharacterized protein n=1 Tax=Corynebacterium urealyticum TaxID=43771 RepID=A0A2W5BDQ9_9CORY|nr:MAG: hypothetical protein DI609_00770 [Corynebacterium urealyticum]